ncbi:hypothetical protein DICPUDRAFT_150489 [Dictyostelium purpureum]|uniref:Uncharacterized protein n=1 Tax=Dictyostelium purpureum TaxID=5786 RepID=F0ZGG1_DICPU|nr:uncharacterized protein DICPUDRAFT_150489 [Dictyostelium purpureum]EGC36951.1 hypothetical protein DICPUDRAFT_150489 [Dictyostelium purpureum]|eukprot:XP_003286519.1 hypothetical protein DICPUDRAFT_150489 [Dictyostelium purpureum]
MEFAGTADVGAEEVVVESKPNRITTFLYDKIPYLKTLAYPGKADDTINEAKGIVSDETFEGCKIGFAFRPSQSFEMGHQFNVYTMNENSRVPRYAGQVAFQNPGTLLFSKIDSERRLSGRFDQSFYDDTINLSFSNSMDKDLTANICYEVDFKLPFSHFSFKGDNENTRAVSFFTSISKRHALGFENTYIGAHNVSILALHYGVRNQRSNFHISATSNFQVLTSFLYKYNHLHVATDLMLGLTQEGKIGSEFSIGARYFFRNNILKFKVDTSGGIHGSYDQMINNFTKFSLCTSINYFERDYKYGLGFNFSK